MSTDFGGDVGGPLFFIVMLAFYFAIFGVPVMQLLARTGHSRLWILIAFVPLVNFVFLWVWAFKRWPTDA
jgi:O-antigen/teichoic acid export membrane protein